MLRLFFENSNKNNFMADYSVTRKLSLIKNVVMTMIFTFTFLPSFEAIFSSGSINVKLSFIGFFFAVSNCLFIIQIKRFFSGCQPSKLVFIELLFVFITGISNIFLFAWVYYYVGVVGGDVNSPIITGDKITSLYFSIVTWTTLGYGDLKPVESLRLVAAAEALMGYIYTAILVGLFLSILQLRINKK